MSLFKFTGLLWIALFTGGVLLWVHALSEKTFTRGQWEARTRDLSQRPIDFFLIGKVLLFIVAALGMVTVMIHLTSDRFPGPDGGIVTSGLFWQGLILYIGVTLMVFVLFRKIEGGVSRVFGLNLRGFVKGVPIGGAAYLMSLPVSLALGFLYISILSYLGVEMESQPVLDALLAMDSTLWIAFSFFFAAIAAPFVEELLFRGILLPYLLRVLGSWGGLLLSCFVFALIHGHLQTFFPLFLISVGFSLSYIWTGSIWVPVVMHGCFNSMNLLIGFAQASGGM